MPLRVGAPSPAVAGSGPLAGSVGKGLLSVKEKSLFPAHFVIRLLDLNYRRAFRMNLCISKTNWEYSLKGSLS